MKKLLTVLSAAVFFVSCGNADTTNTPATTDAQTPAPTTETPAATTASADADKGLELIAKSDCLTCHKVEEKLVGPAYREVANKYPNDEKNIDMLATKIIEGGSGNWGDLAMTAHPTVTKEDAQTMVKYIMSLKQ